MLVPSRFWLLTYVSLGHSLWEAELVAPFLGCGEDEGDPTSEGSDQGQAFNQELFQGSIFPSWCSGF